MSFRAPALYETIDRVDYKEQIDTNFRKIAESFRKVSNEFAAQQGGAGAGVASNLAWVDQQLKPDGPVGVDSWVPSFEKDTDGNFTISISHDTPSGYSYAIIQGILHYTNAAASLSVQAPNPDIASGAYRYVIGLKTLGAPAVELLCEQADGDTDGPGTSDLEIWEFYLVRDTDGDHLQDLRRVTRPHLNADLSHRLDQQVVPMTTFYRGALPTATGNQAIGLIIPFDCEVIGAKAFLRYYPAAGQALQVQLLRQRWVDTGAGTVDPAGDNIEILDGSFYFTRDLTDVPEGASIGAVQKLEATDPPVLLQEDDFVNMKILKADTSGTASGLTFQLLVRPTRHGLLDLY